MKRSIYSAFALTFALLAQPAGAGAEQSSAPTEKSAQAEALDFWGAARSCFQMLNSGKSMLFTMQNLSYEPVVGEAAHKGDASCMRQRARSDTACYITTKKSDFYLFIEINGWEATADERAIKNAVSIAIQSKKFGELPHIFSSLDSSDPRMAKVSYSEHFASLPLPLRAEYEVITRMAYRWVAACGAKPS